MRSATSLETLSVLFILSRASMAAVDKRFGKARIPRQLLEILWRDFIR
jgi:hypothetical protein